MFVYPFIVIDDENPTEVTAGAIVTVTVSLIRRDMSTLFGDDTVPDALPISEGQREEKGDGDGDNGKLNFFIYRNFFFAIVLLNFCRNTCC